MPPQPYPLLFRSDSLSPPTALPPPPDGVFVGVPVFAVGVSDRGLRLEATLDIAVHAEVPHLAEG